MSHFSNSGHPREPVDLVKESDLELTVLDKVMSIGHYEEPGSHIEVEGDVHHDNQQTAHLQSSSVNPFFVEVFQY